MWRRGAGLVLALLIGFFVYRGALAVFAPPPEQRLVSTWELGVSLTPMLSVPVEFDFVTGFPNSPSHSYLYPRDGWERATAHWFRSVLLGLAAIVLVVTAMWRLGPRRRNLVPMREVATLVLTVFLAACAAPGGVSSPSGLPPSDAVSSPSSDPSSEGIQLKTIDMPDGGEGNCMLMYWIADVVADPKFGTVDKTSGEPLAWPSGYTARWAGTEVEVLNRSGKVVLTTGQRYRLSPAYSTYPNGPTAVCAPSPCKELAPSDSSRIVKCRLGESGPL